MTDIDASDLIARLASRIYREAPETQPLTKQAFQVGEPARPIPPPKSRAPLPTAAIEPSSPLPPNSAGITGGAPIAPKVVASTNDARDAARVAPPTTVPPFSADSLDPAPGLSAFVSRVRTRGTTQAEAGDDPLSGLRERLARSVRDVEAGATGGRPYDVAAIRSDFPILHQRVEGHPLIWFDNAATTQKPKSVIREISNYYERDNSNIHRGAHTLAARSTDAYEAARANVATFLGAASASDIVFVRGTTEAINLAANVWGNRFLQSGDEIVLTVLEHHANIVPWQMLADRCGAVLKVAPVDPSGEILLDDYRRLLGPRTRMVALAHANNSLGTVLPIEEMTRLAKFYGARVLVDGAQSVAHLPVDVRALGVDFYAFSGHKIFGPTGIGALYVSPELQDGLPPWQGGGNMIRDVTFEQTTYADPPARFEAGTPNIADAIGLSAALDYVRRLGLARIARHEHDLLCYATERLTRIPGLRTIGHATRKVAVISFVIDGFTTEQIGQHLGRHGIAVRAGHHCAQPSLRRFGLESTVRPSFSIYNTFGEIDRMCDVLGAIRHG